MRLGLGLIKDVGEAAARVIVQEREARGPYGSAADLVSRTGIKPQAVSSLVMAGAFDSVASNRRQALWDAGLATRPPRSGQRTLAASTDHVIPQLDDFSQYEKMVGEYRVMGIYPRGHVMEFVRPTLSGPRSCDDGRVRSAGRAGDSRRRLAHRPPTSTRQGRHRLRDHGRRVRRCAAHSLEGRIRSVPPCPPQPRHHGARRCLSLGRHDEHHRLGNPRHQHRCPHAKRPRLALSL